MGPCCQLAQIAVSSAAPTEHGGPLGANESVNHLCSCSNLYDTLFAMCCRGHSERETDMWAEFCLQESWIAVLLTSPAQPPLSFTTVRVSCSKKKNACLSASVSPDQPGQNEVRGVSVGLKIEIASAPLVYFISDGTHPLFLRINGWDFYECESRLLSVMCTSAAHHCCRGDREVAGCCR